MICSFRPWPCNEGPLKASILADLSTVQPHVGDRVKRWPEAGCWMRSTDFEMRAQDLQEP